MKAKFVEQLIHLKHYAGLTQVEIAKQIGCSPTYLSRVINGFVPTLEFQQKIESVYKDALPKGLNKTREEEIEPAGKRAPMVATDAKSGKSNAMVLKEMPDWRRVPVVSWARAGQFVDFEDLCSQLEEWVEAETRDQNAFAIVVEGDSMEPRFLAGDRVVVAPNSEPRNGNFVVARLRDNGVVFKRFYQAGPNGSQVRLESLNPAYDPILRDRAGFDWIYPVVNMVAKFRY